jgi:5-methylcytosine-specific restriction endonuclease McrA
MKIKIVMSVGGYYLDLCGVPFSPKGKPIRSWNRANALRQFIKKNMEFIGFFNVSNNPSFSMGQPDSFVEKMMEKAYAPIPHSDPRREKVMNKCGGKCMKCGATENLEIDHIKPRSKGGSNKIENLQILCHDCNAKKGSTWNLP